MSWEMVPFESVYSEPSRNGIYKPAEHHGSGAKIVNMGELFAHEFIGAQEMSRLRMSDAELEKAGLIEGDLLFGRRSLVESGAGKCSVVEGVTEPLTFESSIIRVRTDMALVVPRFLYYWFKSRLGRGSIRAIVSGTNVKGIRGSDLKKVLVPLPKKQVQEAIACELSAYDDLIENNRRRIALLQQSARLLYREWFVHLRFPGHEHVKVVNGVPEGWERKPLGDVLTLQRGFDLPTGARVEGEIPIYAATGVHGRHNKPMVNGPGVITGRSGSLGTVAYSPGDFWPLNTTLWVKEFKRVAPEFAYFLLSILGLEQYNGGVAVPTLNRNDVHRIQINLPSQTLMDEFNEFALLHFKQFATLTQQNKKLCQARDLLLPRLMSGDRVV